MQPGEESQELNQLVEFLTSTAEVVLQQLKSIRRRMPTDPNISDLGLDPEVLNFLYLLPSRIKIYFYIYLLFAVVGEIWSYYST